MGKIKQIKLNTNGTPSLQSYKIGADVEDIDYKISNESTKSVREILGEFQTDDASIKEELDDNKQHISNLAEQFLNIEQDFSTIQKKFEEAEPKLDTLIDLDNIVSEKVTNKVNSKKFSTDDIIWTDGIPVNLHKILGNLRNLPYNSVSLRDWIEKISTGQGQGSGDANYENLDYVPLSNYGDISQGANITQVLKTALASGYNIFIDLKSCQIEPGNYTLLPGKMLKGSPTVISIITDENVLFNSDYDQLGPTPTEENQRPALVNFNTKGGAIKDIVFTQTFFAQQLDMPEETILNSPDIFSNIVVPIDIDDSTHYRAIGNIIANNQNRYMGELGDFYNLIPPAMLKSIQENNFVSASLGQENNFAQMLYNMQNYDSYFETGIETLESFYSSKALINFSNTENDNGDNFNLNIENCIFEGGTVKCENMNNNDNNTIPITRQIVFKNCSFVNRQTLNNNLQLTGENYSISNCNFINGYYGISLIQAKNIIVEKCIVLNAERLVYSVYSQDIDISNIEWSSENSPLFFRIYNNNNISIKNIFNLRNELNPPLKIRTIGNGSSPDWANSRIVGQLVENSQQVYLQNITFEQSLMDIICSYVKELNIKNCWFANNLILQYLSYGCIKNNGINKLICLNSQEQNEIENNYLLYRSSSDQLFPINNVTQSSISDTIITEIPYLTSYENIISGAFDLDILIFNNCQKDFSLYNNILNNNLRNGTTNVDRIGSDNVPSNIGMFSSNIFPYLTGYLFTNYMNNCPLMYNEENLSIDAPAGSNKAIGITYLKHYQGEGLLFCPTIMDEGFIYNKYNDILIDNRPNTNVMFKTPTLLINLTQQNEDDEQEGSGDSGTVASDDSGAVPSQPFYSSYILNQQKQIISTYRIVPYVYFFNDISASNNTKYYQAVSQWLSVMWDNSLQLFVQWDFQNVAFNICQLSQNSSDDNYHDNPGGELHI